MAVVIHILVSAALLYVTGKLVDGFEVRDTKAAVVGAVVLGLANWLIRPILDLAALPLTLLTLGLFGVVVSAVVLMLVARVVRGFEIHGFKAALFGALAFGLMNFLVRYVFGG